MGCGDGRRVLIIHGNNHPTEQQKPIQDFERAVAHHLSSTGEELGGIDAENRYNLPSNEVAAFLQGFNRAMFIFNNMPNNILIQQHIFNSSQMFQNSLKKAFQK